MIYMVFHDDSRAMTLEVAKWGKLSNTEGKVAYPDGFWFDD